MRVMYLNGSDWSVTGYWPHQWRFSQAIDLGQSARAPVPTVPARVPGAIHADLLAAGLIPDWQDGLNAERSEWVNNREWVYARSVTIPAEWATVGPTGVGRAEADESTAAAARRRICLECDGLDYSGLVFVDGREVGAFEGTHLRHRFDLTGLVQPGQEFRLEFLFHPSPHIEGVFGYTSRTRVFKPRFGYCWDWCPRVVNIGIWQDVRLVCRGPAEFERIRVQAKLDDALEKGRIRVQGSVTGVAGSIRYQVTNASNEIVASGQEACRAGAVDLKVHVDAPKLWWPATHGEQPLYRLRAELLDDDGRVSDTIDRTVGFRRVRWLNNAGAPAGAKPYLCEVNGVPLFIRGVNWVPLSPFYGTVSRERYEAFLRLYRNLNVNLVRVWGGAILETEDFYDLCDRLGIMVWQEFPLSSSGIENWPPEDPEVIDHLQTIATEYVERRGHHAAHVLWCGGNELQGSLDGSKTGMGKPVDELHPLMTRWQELLADIDPGKRFQASSPSGPTFYAHAENYGKGIHHQTHGPWGNLPLSERYAYWNSDDSLFRSESGSPGCSSLAALERHKGDQALWPPRETNRHWVVPAAAWMPWRDVTREFGDLPDDPAQLPVVVKASRYLQAESYRYAAEASRRRFPTCSGYIIWMGHDNLHNTSNNSVIQIDGSTKPGYDWLQRAYANRHVSFRHSAIACAPGERLIGQVFLHEDLDSRDSFAGGEPGSLTASLRSLDGEILETFERDLDTAETRGAVADVDWVLPECPYGLFVVELRWDRRGAAIVNRYLLSQQKTHPLAPLLRLAEPRLSVRRVSPTQVEVANHGPVGAISVRLSRSGEEGAILTCDNNIILMSGESHLISYALLPLEPRSPAEGRVVVEAFNLSRPIPVD